MNRPLPYLSILVLTYFGTLSTLLRKVILPEGLKRGTQLYIHP